MENNTYRFHWMDGTITESTGQTPAAAFTKAGFGYGAMSVLDYYEEIKEKATNVQSDDRIVYDGYYYNPAMDQSEGDSNELYLGDTFISYITEVRSSNHIEDLITKSPSEKCILIIPRNMEDTYRVRNVNPNPEVFD